MPPGKPRGNAESAFLRCRFCGIFTTEHVEASSPNSARESRHIVAFGLSDTTSRAAVLILRVLMYRRKRSGASSRPASLKGFWRHGFFEAWHRRTAPGWQARSEGKGAMTVLTWSDDRVEQLKKLWEAGLSASQIAAELGNVTRNAVIGKVHRLGLSGRAKSPSSAAPRPRKARPAQHMMRVSPPDRARQYRAGAGLRGRGRGRTGHLRQRGADEPAAVAARAERGHLPLAGRRSLKPGFLLLRRQGALRPALLRPALARRVSARGRSQARSRRSRTRSTDWTAPTHDNVLDSSVS